MYVACENGHLDVVNILIEKNASVNTPSDDGATPLSYACYFGHLKVVEMLLENKAVVDTPDNKECTPLYWAASEGYADIVNILIEQNASVNTPSDVGTTPLSIACYFVHLKVVEMLIENKAVVNTPDNDGITPLFAAFNQGHAEVVNTLLDLMPVTNISKLTGITYSSMTLNLDSRARGVVVAISWDGQTQIRLKLDSELRNVLSERGINADTWTFQTTYSWPEETHFLFTALADFRALILVEAFESLDNTSCPIKTVSCVKVPDLFNVMLETYQNLYNIYTAYMPVLHMLYPNNWFILHLYTNTFLSSIIILVAWISAVLLVAMPCCNLTRITMKKSKVTSDADIPFVSMNPAEAIRDCCPCAQDETAPVEINGNRNQNNEKNHHSILNRRLMIFSILLIFLYPYILKGIKEALHLIFKSLLINSSEESSGWLVVVYRFLGLFLVDSKFGQRSSCSAFYNPLLAGFWADIYGKSSELEGKDFIEYIFENQEGGTSLVSADISTSSLSLSYSIWFHFVGLYFMLKLNYFKKITNHWNSQVCQSRARIFLLILICVAVNISRNFMCFEFSDIWLTFLVRIVMITISSPSSIFLEWIGIRLLQLYFAWFKYGSISLLSYTFHTSYNEDMAMFAYLSRGYLSHAKLTEWKAFVSRYTTVVGSLLEQNTGHNFRSIDTGSIVERFGLPLVCDSELDDLKTDHDVMFVPTDILVSVHGSSVCLIPKPDNLVYMYLYSQNPHCCLLKHIMGEEEKIDNHKGKILMNGLVDNLSLKDFGIENTDSSIKTFLGLTCLTLSQRLFQWKTIQTTITGPAVNFKVKNAHLNPSLFSKDEWTSQVDCDFILAFHLGHWPELATEWLTRPRYWPSQDLVDRVVRVGCDVVPKAGSDQDRFDWRLSFSQVERAMSCQVGEKARMAYIAAKIILKRKLKTICPFVKTYHLKTIFFFHMESKTNEYWEETELEITIRDLLETLACTVRSGSCPHYFIPDVDLWGRQIVGEDAKKIPSQAIRGSKFIRKLLKKRMYDVIIPLEFKSDFILQSVLSDRSFNYYFSVTVLVCTTILLTVASLPVLGLCLAVVTQKLISGLIGSLGCFPLILIFLIVWKRFVGKYI